VWDPPKDFNLLRLEILKRFKQLQIIIGQRQRPFQMELSYGDSDEFTIESNADMRVFYRQHQNRREGMRITVTLYEVAEPDETLIQLIEHINEPDCKAEEPEPREEVL
jgi:hypothetical protein